MGFFQFYDQRISPRIVSWICGTRFTHPSRQRIASRARGQVLEIGMGSGNNLPFYDQSKIEKLWGLEPTATMRTLAARRVASVSFEVELLDLPGEQIPLEDASVDTVVTTWSLCTIPDPVRALEGMRRVLRPGGALLFCEHGESPDDGVRHYQRRAEPIWKKLFGGCHLTRAIPRLIETAGFTVTELDAGYLEMARSGAVPDALKIAAFEYSGMARPG